MHIAILGGGLMGTASAYFLATHTAAPKTMKITVLDRGPIGGVATTASFGNIRRQGRDFRQMPLANRSLALWNELETRLGDDVQFRPAGHLRAVFDAESARVMETFAQEAKPHGLDIELLDAREMQRRFPFVSPKAIGGSFSPNDGSAHPPSVAPAFAKAAMALGANVMPDTQVTDVSVTESGVEIRTQDGVIEADVLLNAAGAWGAKIADDLGEAVPLDTFGPQMGMTAPLALNIPPVVGIWAQDAAQNAYCRQNAQGNVVFGGGMRAPVELRTGEVPALPESLDRQRGLLAHVIPELAGVEVIRTWSACEGYLSDMLPVMGPSQHHASVFHAFGFCGHGFQLGPGVGAVMADLILTGKSDTPVESMDISRFH